MLGACCPGSMQSLLWLIYNAGGGLGYGFRFRSHSCSWQLGLESQSVSDSAVWKLLHSAMYPLGLESESESESGSVNKTLLS